MLLDRSLDGSKTAAVLPLMLTVPVTEVPLAASTVNVESCMVVGSMASLNVALMLVPTSTSFAPSAGLVMLTIGGVVS